MIQLLPLENCKKLLIKGLLLIATVLNTIFVFAQGDEVLSPNWRNLIQNQDLNFLEITDSLDQAYNKALQSMLISDPENIEGSYSEYRRWRNFWMNRVGIVGSSTPPSLKDVGSSMSNIQNLRQSSQNSSSAAFGSSWIPLGPFSFSAAMLGKIESVAYKPNSNIIFAGSENGGLYRRDFSSSSNVWENVTDLQNIPAMGVRDVAIDPLNNSNMVIAAALFFN